jgi:hypothetical protein
MPTLSSPPRSLPGGLIVLRSVGAREYSARIVAHHVAIAGVMALLAGERYAEPECWPGSSRKVGLGSRAAIVAKTW